MTVAQPGLRVAGVSFAIQTHGAIPLSGPTGPWRLAWASAPLAARPRAKPSPHLLRAAYTVEIEVIAPDGFDYGGCGRCRRTRRR